MIRGTFPPSEKSDVFSLSVAEILLMMLFVAMAFSFYSDLEAQIGVTVAEKKAEELEELFNKEKMENKQRKKRIKDLKTEIIQLNDFVNHLLGKRSDVHLQSSEYSCWKLVDVQQKKLSSLMRGCGTGYPRCTVTSGNLFAIHIRSDGMLNVTQRWDEGGDLAVDKVPGAKALVGKGTVTMMEFRRYAEQIFQWSESQKVRCRFHVDASSKAPSLSADFVAERMHVIDTYFYPKRY
ncbi:MAG: hypothetical protein ABFQ95_07745 [Pseudomonadota bacterium]